MWLRSNLVLDEIHCYLMLCILKYLDTEYIHEKTKDMNFFAKILRGNFYCKVSALQKGTSE